MTGWGTHVINNKIDKDKHIQICDSYHPLIVDNSGFGEKENSCPVASSLTFVYTVCRLFKSKMQIMLINCAFDGLKRGEEHVS